MDSSTVSSFCRTCLAYCPISVTVENGLAVKVTGDTESPEYEGYTCPKGEWHLLWPIQGGSARKWLKAKRGG